VVVVGVVMVLRTGGIEDKGDSYRCLSIGEEREIVWCDCDELGGGVNLKIGVEV
jgi:hypothetical protein